MAASHVALLRAVNLGAHNKVAMRDLVELCTGLGMQEVRTLLQSGNVTFRWDRGTTAEIEEAIQSAAASRLKLGTEVFVRTAREWKSIVAGNPFREAAGRDPGHLVVMCLKQAPSRAEVAALQAAITGREEVRVRGREAYFVYPDGIGRSRLTMHVIERELGTAATGRNWNTVVKIAGLLGV